MDESKKKNSLILNYAKDFQTEEEMHNFYLEHGFVSLKKAIPTDYIKNIVDDLTLIFKPYASDLLNPIDSGILNLDKNDKPLLHNTCLSVRQLSSLKKMTGFFQDIMIRITGEKKPIFEIQSDLLLGISKDKRLVYDFHQESNFMKGFNDILNIHYPLLRTSNLENGTMSILPGTHKLGTLDFQKSRKTNDSYTNLLPKSINEIINNFPEMHCYLEVGDVLFFDKDLIHKSNYNSSSLCRPVGIQRLTQATSGVFAHTSPEDL